MGCLKFSAGLIALSALLAVDAAGGESAAARRYNEARQLDGKLRAPSTPAPEDRRLRELQLRQQRQLPPTGSSPLVREPHDVRPRLEREQRGQELDAKLQQPLREPVRPDTGPRPSRLIEEWTAGPSFNDRQ